MTFQIVFVNVLRQLIPAVYQVKLVLEVNVCVALLHPVKTIVLESIVMQLTMSANVHRPLIHVREKEAENIAIRQEIVEVVNVNVQRLFQHVVHQLLNATVALVLMVTNMS